MMVHSGSDSMLIHIPPVFNGDALGVEESPELAIPLAQDLLIRRIQTCGLHRLRPELGEGVWMAP